ncbi:AI-2E family transporter [Fodinibacter luteus]|uniref:AI-2E family transporter n=1 Tax=Fodinibacter luteus TaxID=552064 RepID=A0ABP8KJ56_9MICO
MASAYDGGQGVLRQDALPRPLLIVLGLAAVTLAVAGIRETAWLVAPTTLGVVLVVTVAPVRTAMERRGAPVWSGILVTILLVYAILITLVVSIAVSGAKLASLIPQYTSEMDDLVDGLGSRLASLGLQEEQVASLASSLDLGRITGILTGLASNVAGVIGSLIFIATLVLFIGFDSGKFPRNLFAARGERPSVVDALTSFAKGTRTYLTVSAIFGLIVAVIDGVVLALLGIPGAFVWGVLAFVTNFIPNIGFVIGVIPPAIIGLLEGGPSLMLAVIALYSVINFVIQSIIQPKFQADALGLTTTLTFLSLAFWAWVLGPLGAILALPLTLLLKALLVDVDPQARWLGPLLSGVPPADSEAEAHTGAEADTHADPDPGVGGAGDAPAARTASGPADPTDPVAGPRPATPPNDPRR